MMEKEQNSISDHQLWVSLSALGDGNVFAILPQLMKDMLNEEDLPYDLDDELIDVILPSDDAWQTKIYYQLVEKQRLADAGEEAMFESIRDEKDVKLHDWNIIPKTKSVPCDTALVLFQKQRRKLGPGPITWTVCDIAKAGSLLTVPPVHVVFEDEQEMRRVYTLIYDVFRYKNVLTQALNDAYFFQMYTNSKLSKTVPQVWLLFYDLYHRSFKKREVAVLRSSTKLFEAAGIMNIEIALWDSRVKLAAAIARLRIKANALSLSELLPQHLKDERVTEIAQRAPVTCWVNSKLIDDPKKICIEIEKQFQLSLSDDVKPPKENQYKWDLHCPQIIAFHHSMRPQLAKSSLIKTHKLVVQDRSFCLGPATFGKLISDLELTGSVIQTHVNSPRTTAYLATLLSQNEKIKKLMAFGAGKRKREYERYFREIGITNISIFSDRLIDSPPDAPYMEEVVAVFATPPNSYSAVTDPIDLVCSRGGDLSMLEILTESEETKAGKERVANILDEQRKTLRFAMSRPQIQFVLYETHSELEAENYCMVKRALKDINRVAKLHHATLQGKLCLTVLQNTGSASSTDIREINNNEDDEDGVPNVHKKVSLVSKLPHLGIEHEEKILQNIKVPDTDLFDLPNLPALCSSDSSCLNFQKEGCYLALLQRKKIIRLDDKYMIQMAENRGLFGSNTTSTTSKSKSTRASKKKVEKVEPVKKSKKRVKDLEIDRIAAPTHAFLRHTRLCQDDKSCPRCEIEENPPHIPQYRRWWPETTRHIVALKSSLIKQKLIPPKKYVQANSKSVVNSLLNNTLRVDEIVAKFNQSSRIPIFPKLRLTRDIYANKVQIPVTITNVKFPSDTCLNMK